MALNKQKILNELGNVVNQLQSADCGCMGKLFQQTSQNPQFAHNEHTHSSCGGYCHNRCNVPNPSCNHGVSSNEPQIGNSHQHSHCMGQCNPPKLYTDTYNYLNTNLMQPVVKEVYEELKSISPENTIMNNSLGNQMNLPNAGILPSTSPNMYGQNLNSGQAGHQMPSAHTMQNNNATGGLGPNILSMLKSEAKQNYVQGIQENNNTIANPYTSNVTQPNAYPKPTTHTVAPCYQLPNNTSNVQISTTQHQSYGEHNEGVAKFKEMFPGVMDQNNLGFDPMAIAIQMNPANQQQRTMNTMQNGVKNNDGKVCPSSPTNVQPNVMNNVSHTTPQMNQYQLNSQLPVASANPQQMSLNKNNPSSQLPSNNTIFNNNQQLYPAMTEAQTINPNQGLNQMAPQQQFQQHETTSNNFVPNVHTNLPTIYEGSNVNQVPWTQPGQINPGNFQPLAKEPIFPATTNQPGVPIKSQKSYEYNTLGQPIELLPANYYHNPEPRLPQTLSPEPMPVNSLNPTRFSNVKSTLSKTSLIGNRTVSKAPSRSRLQPMHNQYKASQSLTQQNIKASDGMTHSEGNLYIPQNTIPGNLHVEKNGGDNINNNETKQEMNVGQTGDVLANEEARNITEKVPPNLRRSRNGLQDLVYTSYPTSTAWSFHGQPATAGEYRSRNRI